MRRGTAGHGVESRSASEAMLRLGRAFSAIAFMASVILAVAALVSGAETSVAAPIAPSMWTYRLVDQDPGEGFGVGVKQQLDTVKTPVADTAVVTRLPTASGEAGPGGTVELKIYDPNSTVTGTMALEAPAGTSFTSVSNNIGATVGYSADRRKATISRTSFGGAAATVWAKITLPFAAVPTSTYAGTVTVADNAAIVATGALNIYATADGCIAVQETPIPTALVVWLFPVQLTNRCYAKIDARVIFGGGPDAGWQTVPVRTAADLGTATYWSTPYARYDHYEIGNITRP